MNEWENPSAHITLLQNFFEMWWNSRPQSLTFTKDEFMLRAHLGLLTRCIGALYDVAEQISHTKRPLNTKQKRDAFVQFIIAILDWNMDVIVASSPL